MQFLWSENIYLHFFPIPLASGTLSTMDNIEKKMQFEILNLKSTVRTVYYNEFKNQLFIFLGSFKIFCTSEFLQKWIVLHFKLWINNTWASQKKKRKRKKPNKQKTPKLLLIKFMGEKRNKTKKKNNNKAYSNAPTSILFIYFFDSTLLLRFDSQTNILLASGSREVSSCLCVCFCW